MQAMLKIQICLLWYLRLVMSVGVVYFQVKSILKYLFPVPKDDSRRVMTFSNEDDFISYR